MQISPTSSIGYYLTISSGTTVAIYEVGCALGALACAILGDKLGRRKTIFLAGCIVLVGVAIQASPFSLGQLIAGRVITGKDGNADSCESFN